MGCPGLIASIDTDSIKKMNCLYSEICVDMMSFIYSIVAMQNFEEGDEDQIAGIVKFYLKSTLMKLIDKCPHEDKFKLTLVVDGIAPSTKRARSTTRLSTFVKRILVRHRMDPIWKYLITQVESKWPNCKVRGVRHHGEAEAYGWSSQATSTVDIFDTKKLSLQMEPTSNRTIVLSCDSDIIIYDMLNNSIKVDAGYIDKRSNQLLTTSYLKTANSQRYKVVLLTLVVSYGCDYLEAMYTPSKKKEYFFKVKQYVDKYYDQYWNAIKQHVVITMIPLPILYKLAFPIIWSCIYTVASTRKRLPIESDDLEAALASQWKMFNNFIDYVCKGKRISFNVENVSHIKTTSAAVYYQNEFNSLLAKETNNIYIKHLTVCQN